MPTDSRTVPGPTPAARSSSSLSWRCVVLPGWMMVESTVEGAHDVRGILGADTDVRNGFNDIKVTFTIDADASRQEIEALVAQSQKRSAVFDALTNPTNVTVEVA